MYRDDYLLYWTRTKVDILWVEIEFGIVLLALFPIIWISNVAYSLLYFIIPTHIPRTVKVTLGSKASYSGRKIHRTILLYNLEILYQLFRLR